MLAEDAAEILIELARESALNGVCKTDRYLMGRDDGMARAFYIAAYLVQGKPAEFPRFEQWVDNVIREEVLK